MSQILRLFPLLPLRTVAEVTQLVATTSVATLGPATAINEGAAVTGRPVEHDLPGGATGGLPEPRRPLEATSGIRRSVTLVDRLIEREIEREIEDGLRRLDRLTAVPRIASAVHTAADDVRPRRSPEGRQPYPGTRPSAPDAASGAVAATAASSPVAVGAGGPSGASRIASLRAVVPGGQAGTPTASSGSATAMLPGLPAPRAATRTTSWTGRAARSWSVLVAGVALVLAAACLALTMRPVLPAPIVDLTVTPPGPAFVIHPDGLRVGMPPQLLPVQISAPSALPLTVTGLAPVVDRLPADCPASAWWIQPGTSSPVGTDIAGGTGTGPVMPGATIPAGGSGSSGLAVALAAGAPASCADRAIDLDVLVAGSVGGAPVELTSTVTLVTGPSDSSQGTGLPRNGD
jgi:hypothetical protein